MRDKMESVTVARRLSRKSKPVSVLPTHPELDSTHRRSGIRHFSNLPSFRKPATTPQREGVRKFSNFGKFKAKKSVVSELSGPMKFRALLHQEDSFDPAMGDEFKDITRATAMEEHALKELATYQADPNSMYSGRVPSPGRGCFVLPDSETKMTMSQPPSLYPYPQHIPPAAAVWPAQPVNCIPCHSPSAQCQPHSGPPQRYHGVNITIEEVLNVLYGIGIAIVALFMWIFRTEAIKYGTVIAIAVLACKLGNWHTRVALEKREKELIEQRRLLPEEPTEESKSYRRWSPEAGYMPGRRY